MAEEQRFILRILVGPNAGAEARLTGRTVVGSAETADIMIGDPDLAAEHFTITVQGDVVSLTVGEAPVTIGKESKSGGTFRLSPYELIKFGSTCCAIGPENAVWPSFAAADLLPAPVVPPPVVSPEPPTEAKDALAATASATSIAGERPRGPSKAATERVWGLRYAVATVVVLAIAVGGTGYFLFGYSSPGDEASAGQATAQDIVQSLQASSVTIRPDDGGGLVAEGFVATSEQQRRLRTALLAAGLAVKYRVVSLEQQVVAARTIISSAGAQLSVEPDLASGKILVDGFLPDMSSFETLQRVLQRDISDLRPIEAHVATPASVGDDAKKQLAAAGLEASTRIDVTGSTVRISGALPEESRAAVRRVVDNLNARWSRFIKIEDATGAGNSPVPIAAPSQQVTVRSAPLSDKITVVAAGKNGFIRDSAGRRYGVGDKLVNGEVIEEIRVEEVVTSRNGVKYRYTFGGGR